MKNLDLVGPNSSELSNPNKVGNAPQRLNCFCLNNLEYIKHWNIKHFHNFFENLWLYAFTFSTVKHGLQGHCNWCSQLKVMIMTSILEFVSCSECHKCLMFKSSVCFTISAIPFTLDRSGIGFCMWLHSISALNCAPLAKNLCIVGIINYYYIGIWSRNIILFYFFI